jgi:GT2 family glycosyltransferase
MELAIVIVNWNTRESLAQCLYSVQAALSGVPGDRCASDVHSPNGTPSTPPGQSDLPGSRERTRPDLRCRPNDAPLAWQVIVVDSASSDGSAEMVRRDFPQVTLLELVENRGFGAAANRALARFLSLSPGHLVTLSDSSARQDDQMTKPTGGAPSPQAVLLLNADTEIVGTAIQEMVAYLKAHADVGIVGPQLRYPDGQVQSSRRRFPTPGTLFWESTVLEQYFPGNPWARRYHMADRPNDVVQEVDWLVGACLLIRSAAIAQAGLLDAGYFLYFEELEWCRRIQQAGWRVVYLPTACVIHHEGRSSEQVPLQRHLHFGRSKVRYTREVFGSRWAGLLRSFLLVTFAWQWLIEAGKWLLGHKRRLRRERMRIYAAVLKDGLRSEK